MTEEAKRDAPAPAPSAEVERLEERDKNRPVEVHCMAMLIGRATGCADAAALKAAYDCFDYRAALTRPADPVAEAKIEDAIFNLEQATHEAAVTAERERCAKVARDYLSGCWRSGDHCAEDVAAAIRALKTSGNSQSGSGG